MRIVSPELLQKASELPSLVLLLAAAVGPLFWGLRWRIHRALVVAASTLVGGLYGLAHGPALGLYPGIAAGLLSLSAAGLALSLLRIGVFVVMGALAEYAVSRAVAGRSEGGPGGTWINVAAFFMGGLISLVCYRFLIVLVTSFTGAALLLIGGLGFAARHGDADTIAWATDRPGLLSAALICMGFMGAAGQYLIEWRRAAETVKSSVHELPAP